MSVTLNGGVTFGGGLTLSAAPPSTPTAGWFVGGATSTGRDSTVDRITYATDTATASVRGPLDAVRYALAGTGNLNYGWFGGNRLPSGALSTVSRITYATDTATATARGPLSYSTYHLTATGSDTYGWFGGGQDGASPSGYSTVSRITYASDTATATGRGPLTIPVYDLAASTDSTTYGWYGGGLDTNAGNYTSIVARITYATDTATATDRGPLSSIRSKLAATGTSSYGWFGGGYAPYSSRVDRIDYANDTGTASIRGPLSVARVYPAASTDSSTYGWFGGGYTGVAPGYKSLVDRITYATDTATATARGPLSRSVYQLAATSGVQ